MRRSRQPRFVAKDYEQEVITNLALATVTNAVATDANNTTIHTFYETALPFPIQPSNRVQTAIRFRCESF
jgi:hypothetical protein